VDFAAQLGVWALHGKGHRTGADAGYGTAAPVEFPAHEQAEAYRRFTKGPAHLELERFSILDDVDVDLIALLRTDAHRLGMAVQSWRSTTRGDSRARTRSPYRSGPYRGMRAGSADGTSAASCTGERDASRGPGDVAALWAAVEETVPHAAVAGAVATVEILVPEDDRSAEAAMREKPALRHKTVHPSLSLLDKSDALGAAPGRTARPHGGASPAHAVQVTGHGPAADAPRDPRRVGVVDAATRGVHMRQGAPGRGRPRSVRGARAGEAAPRPEPA
jgi:hypothetical protein